MRRRANTKVNWEQLDLFAVYDDEPTEGVDSGESIHPDSQSVSTGQPTTIQGIDTSGQAGDGGAAGEPNPISGGDIDNRSGSYHVLAFHDRMKARVGNGGWCSGSASAVVAEAVVPLHTSRSANRIRAQIAFVFR